ncbi:unnamed protein product [Somion occarium]
MRASIKIAEATADDLLNLPLPDINLLNPTYRFWETPGSPIVAVSAPHTVVDACATRVARHISRRNLSTSPQARSISSNASISPSQATQGGRETSQELSPSDRASTSPRSPISYSIPAPASDSIPSLSPSHSSHSLDVAQNVDSTPPTVDHGCATSATASDIANENSSSVLSEQPSTEPASAPVETLPRGGNLAHLAPSGEIDQVATNGATPSLLHDGVEEPGPQSVPMLTSDASVVFSPRQDVQVVSSYAPQTVIAPAEHIHNSVRPSSSTSPSRNATLPTSQRERGQKLRELRKRQQAGASSSTPVAGTGSMVAKLQESLKQAFGNNVKSAIDKYGNRRTVDKVDEHLVAEMEALIGEDDTDTLASEVNREVNEFMNASAMEASGPQPVIWDDDDDDEEEEMELVADIWTTPVEPNLAPTSKATQSVEMTVEREPQTMVITLDVEGSDEVMDETVVDVATQVQDPEVDALAQRLSLMTLDPGPLAEEPHLLEQTQVIMNVLRPIPQTTPALLQHDADPEMSQFLPVVELSNNLAPVVPDVDLSQDHANQDNVTESIVETAPLAGHEPEPEEIAPAEISHVVLSPANQDEEQQPDEPESESEEEAEKRRQEKGKFREIVVNSEDSEERKPESTVQVPHPDNNLLISPAANVSEAPSLDNTDTAPLTLDDILGRAPGSDILYNPLPEFSLLQTRFDQLESLYGTVGAFHMFFDSDQQVNENQVASASGVSADVTSTIFDFQDLTPPTISPTVAEDATSLPDIQQPAQEDSSSPALPVNDSEPTPQGTDTSGSIPGRVIKPLPKRCEQPIMAPMPPLEEWFWDDTVPYTDPGEFGVSQTQDTNSQVDDFAAFMQGSSFYDSQDGAVQNNAFSYSLAGALNDQQVNENQVASATHVTADATSTVFDIQDLAPPTTYPTVHAEDATLLLDPQLQQSTEWDSSSSALPANDSDPTSQGADTSGSIPGRVIKSLPKRHGQPIMSPMPPIEEWHWDDTIPSIDLGEFGVSETQDEYNQAQDFAALMNAPSFYDLQNGAVQNNTFSYSLGDALNDQQVNENQVASASHVVADVASDIFDIQDLTPPTACPTVLSEDATLLLDPELQQSTEGDSSSSALPAYDSEPTPQSTDTSGSIPDRVMKPLPKRHGQPTMVSMPPIDEWLWGDIAPYTDPGEFGASQTQDEYNQAQDFAALMNAPPSQDGMVQNNTSTYSLADALNPDAGTSRDYFVDAQAQADVGYEADGSTIVTAQISEPTPSSLSGALGYEILLSTQVPGNATQVVYEETAGREYNEPERNDYVGVQDDVDFSTVDYEALSARWDYLITTTFAPDDSPGAPPAAAQDNHIFAEPSYSQEPTSMNGIQEDASLNWQGSDSTGYSIPVQYEPTPTVSANIPSSSSFNFDFAFSLPSVAPPEETHAISSYVPEPTDIHLSPRLEAFALQLEGYMLPSGESEFPAESADFTEDSTVVHEEVHVAAPDATEVTEEAPEHSVISAASVEPCEPSHSTDAIPLLVDIEPTSSYSSLSWSSPVALINDEPHVPFTFNFSIPLPVTDTEPVHEEPLALHPVDDHPLDPFVAPHSLHEDVSAASVTVDVQWEEALLVQPKDVTPTSNVEAEEALVTQPTISDGLHDQVTQAITFETAEPEANTLSPSTQPMSDPLPSPEFVTPTTGRLPPLPIIPELITPWWATSDLYDDVVCDRPSGDSPTSSTSSTPVRVEPSPALPEASTATPSPTEPPISSPVIHQATVSTSTARPIPALSREDLSLALRFANATPRWYSYGGGASLTTPPELGLRLPRRRTPRYVPPPMSSTPPRPLYGPDGTRLRRRTVRDLKTDQSQVKNDDAKPTETVQPGPSRCCADISSEVGKVEHSGNTTAPVQESASSSSLSPSRTLEAVDTCLVQQSVSGNEGSTTSTDVTSTLPSSTVSSQDIGTSSALGSTTQATHGSHQESPPLTTSTATQTTIDGDVRHYSMWDDEDDEDRGVFPLPSLLQGALIGLSVAIPLAWIASWIL